MSLASALAQGSHFALALIKRYVTQPMVGPVSIETTRFERTMDADVSKKVLIDLTQGKRSVLDNVAPGPRTWELEGNIGGVPGELTSAFMPSITAADAILDNLSQSRQVVTLRDQLYREYSVLIARYRSADLPEMQNRKHVEMTLVEITVLTAGVTTGGGDAQVESLATPTPGGASGVPANAGVTETVAKDLPVPVAP